MMRALRTLAREERGFTVVELMVGMVLTLIVAGVAFTLVEVSLSSTERVHQRVDVAQRGRRAMETVTQQLRSQVCLATDRPAIVQADGSSITFYSFLGDVSGAFQPEQRTLTYANGAITERVYPTTGTPPDVVPAASPSRTRTLIDGIAQNGTTPVFRYYAFGTTDPVAPSVLLPAPLSDSDRARTVQVNISFVAQPLRGDVNDRVRAVFENQVYVRTSDPTDPTRSPKC